MTAYGTHSERTVTHERLLISMKKATGFRRCAFALACLFALLLAGCGQTADMAEQGKSSLPVLRLGCDVYPPYNMTGADGKPTGIDIDLAREALHRMGYEPEFINIDWENKKALLEDGEIDCIWSSFSIDGREEDYRWAGPYMTSRQVVAVVPGSGITSLSDLAGKNVAVQATTKPEEIFLSDTDERIPALRNVFSVQDRELIYPMLSKGYVDAVAAHETSILQYMHDYGVEYRILEEPLLTVGLGVAFARSDTRGIDVQLGQTLEQMRTDGTTKEIIERYLPSAEGYLEVARNAG